MTVPIRIDADILIERILWRYFNPIHRPIARNALQHMFKHCFSQCVLSPEGHLRQSLVLSYLEFNRFNEANRSRQVAIVYLQLRSG